MKKLILPILLTASISATAQRLPDTLKFSLDKKVIMHLDSVIVRVSNNIDSKSETRILQDAISPLWEQVRKQLIIDKSKVEKK